MSVHFMTLNEHTVATYGFQVGDWDNRPNSDSLCVIGKHEFSLTKPTYLGVAPTLGNDTVWEPANLQGLSVDSIGKIFNKVFQGYQQCEISGQKYKPQIIYLRVTSENNIPDEPFLFVVGVKV